MRTTSRDYTSPTRIVFGCGYLGLPTAALWVRAGDHVIGYSRCEQRSTEFAAAGLWMATGDVTRRESLTSLANLPALGGGAPEALLYAVGYDRNAGSSIYSVYADGLRNVLAALPASVRRVIYISTTGVYGPAGGEWVDEQTPPDPQREGGRASLAAEQILAAHQLGEHSTILRLAGIYGPGRVPHLDKIRAGEPLPVPHDGWLNLIHVEDAARIVVSAEAWLAEREKSPEEDTAQGPHIFCVADGSPVRREDYYREVARLLDAPPPQFVTPPADSAAAARAGSNRRIRNDKMRQSLSVELRYPSYREGLASILNGE